MSLRMRDCTTVRLAIHAHVYGVADVTVGRFFYYTPEYRKCMYADVNTCTHTADGAQPFHQAPVTDAKNAAQLTALVSAISTAVKAALPSAQVTFFSDILGFESSVDQFDLVGIAKAVDYLVVGCYEVSGAALQCLPTRCRSYG